MTLVHGRLMTRLPSGGMRNGQRSPAFSEQRSLRIIRNDEWRDFWWCSLNRFDRFRRSMSPQWTHPHAWTRSWHTKNRRSRDVLVYRLIVHLYGGSRIALCTFSLNLFIRIGWCPLPTPAGDVRGAQRALRNRPWLLSNAFTQERTVGTRLHCGHWQVRS